MKLINSKTPAQIAIRHGQRILDRMERDGADYVRADGAHAYIWHREQLVSLYDHRQILTFLAQHGYIRPRTENKMIIAAWIIFAGLQRCA